MVVIVNFSNRENGNSISISNTLRNYYRNKEVHVFNFGSLKIESCGKCNYECLKETDHCPIDDDINLIYNAIMKSEITLFIVPNYCDYPCSNFFIFNGRSCGIFNRNSLMLEKYSRINKKFIVISNTNKQNFKDIFKYQIQNEEAPNILFLSAKKFNKNSLNGDLMEDESARSIVINFSEDNYTRDKFNGNCIFWR